jgi:uncharacterized protein with PQ loop repeat
LKVEAVVMLLQCVVFFVSVVANLRLQRLAEMEWIMGWVKQKRTESVSIVMLALVADGCCQFSQRQGAKFGQRFSVRKNSRLGNI